MSETVRDDQQVSDLSVPPQPGLLRRVQGGLSLLGPGIAVAATGVGAGDLISSTTAGAQFGTLLLWSALYSAVLKFVLNEGVARWQLATGTTLLEGWVEHLGRPVQYYFLLYLIGWSFLVGGGLISSCGLAAHTMMPALSVNTWAILHSVVGAAIVLWGRYSLFERIMKVLIGVMFFSFLICAWALRPGFITLLRGLVIPSIPAGSVKSILSVIGGVGGSLTILCYGYWIRESGRAGAGWLRGVRIDLGSAYSLTGFFGVAVMVLAAQVQPEVVKGSGIVLGLADRMVDVLGPTGRWALYVGFWGAVVTSLLGVWQGIPYMFADFVALMKRLSVEERAALVSSQSPYYRAFLFFLTVPTMLLLTFGRPVTVVRVYTIAGALFMPFLAATLLYMNSRRAWVGSLRSGWVTNVLLVMALAVFAYLSINGVVEGAGN
ncbi:MAG: Nramp family divalent metal transporter [Candidatus Latescibacteria bacterium]|nr:Nramp family divalent metal transporter [Candidatus Latescibacterota bacterium]